MIQSTAVRSDLNGCRVKLSVPLGDQELEFNGKVVFVSP